MPREIDGPSFRQVLLDNGGSEVGVLKEIVAKRPTYTLSLPTFLGIFEPHALRDSRMFAESIIAQRAFSEIVVNQQRQIIFFLENGAIVPRAVVKMYEGRSIVDIGNLLVRSDNYSSGAVYTQNQYEQIQQLQDEYPQLIGFEFENPPKTNLTHVDEWISNMKIGQGNFLNLYESTVLAIAGMMMRDFRLAAQIANSSNQDNRSVVVIRGTLHMGLVNALHLFSPGLVEKLDIEKPRLVSHKNPRVLTILQLLWNREWWKEVSVGSKMNIYRANTDRVADVGRVVKRLLAPNVQSLWSSYLTTQLQKSWPDNDNSMGQLSQILDDPLISLH